MNARVVGEVGGWDTAADMSTIYYRVLLLLLMICMPSIGTDSEQKARPKKAIARIAQLFSKRAKRAVPSKDANDSGPELFLPYELWPCIAGSLEVGDYLHLACVNKTVHIALGKKELLDRLIKRMHSFSFPIFEDAENPYQTLKNVHYYTRARGNQKPTSDLKDEDVFLPGTTDFFKSEGTGVRKYALNQNGSIYVWGKNIDGLLGQGKEDEVIDEPIPIAGELEHRNVIALSLGAYFIMALTSDGKVFLWGKVPRFGRAIPDTMKSKGGCIKTPVPMGGDLVGKQVIAIAAGYHHCLALSADGEVFKWADPGCGFKSAASEKMATSFKGPWKAQRIIGIAAAAFNSFAITENGVLYVWGRNGNHELGLTYPQTITKPMPFRFLNGHAHVIAIKPVPRYRPSWYIVKTYDQQSRYDLWGFGPNCPYAPNQYYKAKFIHITSGGARIIDFEKIANKYMVQTCAGRWDEVRDVSLRQDLDEFHRNN